MHCTQIRVLSKSLLCSVLLLMGSACTQDEILSPTTEKTVVERIISGSEEYALIGDLTLPTESTNPRALQYDLVASKSSNSTNLVVSDQLAYTGAFKGKFEVGKSVKVWTIIKSASQSKPLYCEEIDWIATSEGRLEPSEGLIRILAPTGTSTTDWSIGGFIVGSSGVAGQVFEFDKETLRLKITTPDRASSHLDHKASELNRTGITSLPTIYTFGWSPITMTKTTQSGKTVYRASIGTLKLSPRGTVLRLLSYIDLDYNLFSLRTKRILGELGIGWANTTFTTPEEVEKASKQALAEANRLTKGTAYIQPVRGVLKGVKDGYIDFSQTTMPFVAETTHDFVIPPIEEGEAKYNPLVPNSADAANAKRGALYLWVASEEGTSTSAEYQLETEFISYLTTEKEYDDKGTDPQFPGTQGTYWTETRRIVNGTGYDADSWGIPYPENTLSADYQGIMRNELKEFASTPRKTLSFGIWSEVESDLRKAIGSTSNLNISSLFQKRVQGSALKWVSVPYEIDKIPSPLPYSVDYVVHLPRYDQPTTNVLRKSLKLQKGRTAASLIIYSVMYGDYEGVRTTLVPAGMNSYKSFGTTLEWHNLPE